jgi:hypothetical protein
MIELAVMLFVAAVLLVAAYAVLRPFTHVRYRHTSRSLWRPLD